GKHRGVTCEACHGPAALHAGDPEKSKPVRPQIVALCGRCHEADRAKPSWFKQVATREHNSGTSCEACHQPHSPNL
ncbi:cytochrome C, partial [bacterium]|nr:cytochrome C [bacterium]